MHHRIIAPSLAFLAFVVVACGNSGADSSNADAGSSQGGSSATSSGGAGDTPGGGATASPSGGSADSSGSGAATSLGGSADGSGSGATATSSGGSGDSSGSGGIGSALGGSAGNAGGATGGSTGRGGRGGDVQGGVTSSGGGAATGGRAAAGTGGSGAAGSGGRSDAAGSGSGGDTTGGRGGGDTGGATGGGGSGLTDPAASQGCGQDPPADGHSTIDVGGSEREYILRLPEGYDADKPNRIIFAFHGASGSAVQVDNGDPPRSDLEPTGPYFGIKDAADQQTIFVAGQASGGWSSSDIEYVRVLLDHLEAALCIDTTRIFATGFSMGGMMTITVACSLSDIFRAVAPMSGSLQNGCPEGGQHIAYWSSHGTSDPTIDISQGEAARDEFVQRNHCQTATTPTEPEGCVSYQGCDAGYPVEWCPFDGVHEPPPFSGSAIWAFISQF